MLPRFLKVMGQESHSERVERLARSLEETSHLINQINSKLQSDAEIYNPPKGLKPSEVEAVAKLLQVELRKEGQRAFWKNVAITFLFTVLSVIVAVFLTKC